MISDATSAWLDRAKDAHDRVTKIRGTYISGVIGIESVMDDVLEAFVHPHDEARLALRTAILANMSFLAKVDVIAAVVAETDLEGDFSDLPGQLKRINALRNRFAHDDVRIQEGPRGKDSTFTLKAYRKKDRTIDANEMARELDELGTVMASLLLLTWELQRRRVGKSEVDE